MTRRLSVPVTPVPSFLASPLRGFVICEDCASVVVASKQERHYACLHGDGRFRRDRVRSAIIRAWAASQGIAVRDRGRLPSLAIEMWVEAGRPYPGEGM